LLHTRESKGIPQDEPFVRNEIAVGIVVSLLHFATQLFVEIKDYGAFDLPYPLDV
jgi:hypothetical protein